MRGPFYAIASKFLLFVNMTNFGRGSTLSLRLNYREHSRRLHRQFGQLPARRALD